MSGFSQEIFRKLTNIKITMKKSNLHLSFITNKLKLGCSLNTKASMAVLSD